MRYFNQLTTASLLALVAGSVSAAPSQAKQLQQLQKQTHALQKQVRQLRYQAYRHNGQIGKSKTTSSPAMTNVITSPLLGTKSAYDAADLLDQQPRMNEDLTLLKQRKKFIRHLRRTGQAMPRPLLEVSGALEGNISHLGGYAKATTPQNTGVSLNTAQLDFQALVSPWAAGFMSVKYNSLPANSSSPAPAGGVSLDRGFVTLGNLNKSPLYFSVGDMYVPFGQFSTPMYLAPVTTSLARIKSPTALIGYYSKGLNLVAFGYGGSQKVDNDMIFQQGGARVSYEFKHGANDLTVGASMVSNIADAAGMQNNGVTDTSKFTGFAAAGQPTYRTPGMDINAKLAHGNYTLLVEYAAATKAFEKDNLSFNGKPAKPAAWRVEGDYSLKVHGKPANIAVAYGQTTNALALNLPAQSISAFFNISWFKNTVEGIELRHDMDYKNGDNGGDAVPATQITGSGKSRNSVLAQVGVYF
jgi:hypothetical protein